MKLGLFGGTFNPPHNGHLIVIECVRDTLQLDSVIFVPSAQTPNKRNVALASSAARLEMTRLAVKGNPKFEISDIELRRRGISYTIDTVIELALKYSGASLSLIIGADNFLEFETWKSPDEILSRTELIVMSRPGFDVGQAHGKYLRAAKFVNVPQIGISGTDIRRRIKFNRSIRYLVPKPVEDYIAGERLYKN